MMKKMMSVLLSMTLAMTAAAGPVSAGYRAAHVLSAGPAEEQMPQNVHCGAHMPSYHQIPASLIDYIGARKFAAWEKARQKEADEYGRANEQVNIARFLKDFPLPRQTFVKLVSSISDEELARRRLTRNAFEQQYGYTAEQIDALYSGDQKRIDAAFCGELAAVLDDGSVCSIHWMAAHPAEDYNNWNNSQIYMNIVWTANLFYADDPGIMALVDKANETLRELGSEEHCRNGLGCEAHLFSYHMVPDPLVSYAGDAAKAWLSARDGQESFTIQQFLEDFHIPREDFVKLTQGRISDDFLVRMEMTREEAYELYGYTDEQIDALYSGDQRRIDAAFLGELAFINPSDRLLYSVYWLAEHTAEEYLEADLPLEKVRALIDKIETEYYFDNGAIAELDRIIWNQYDRARRMKGYGSCGSFCVGHDGMIHSFDTELLSYVGYENFMAWEGSLPPPAPDQSGCYTCVDGGIVDFVRYFKIPKDTFTHLLTDHLDETFIAENRPHIYEEIDAIYSGDEREVNRAFCGDLAFVDEKTGRLYTIYWLADHISDYRLAGFPISEVEALLERAEAYTDEETVRLANLIRRSLNR